MAKMESGELNLHTRLLTLDSHVDTPLRIMHDNIHLTERHSPELDNSRLDFPRMREGGLDGVFFAVWTAQGERTPEGHQSVFEKADHILDVVDAEIGKYSDQAATATRSTDLKRLAGEGKFAIFLGMENGYPVGRSLDNLDYFYRRGIRYMTLCHTKNNEISDSSNDEPEHGGLSPFGVEVVKHMNHLGMMVDVSHLSDDAVRNVLEISSVPVIASHSCAKALCDNPRNLSDSLLTAIALQGGVVQLAFFSEYLETPRPDAARDSAFQAFRNKWGNRYDLDSLQLVDYRWERAELNQKFPPQLATLETALNHLDHMVSVMGVDHVGIGSDFDGGAALADCQDVSCYPRITAALLKRGYSLADIEKIWSGNLLRVMTAVEDFSTSL
ncbi:MAG: dipeptidase [Lentisphaeria bacterium]|nr:dipeptidase [Candidatus Neomarinimicrobiota bacterium]MCF7842589.1 dipeptidase [Lentisphaeria bacterium]